MKKALALTFVLISFLITGFSQTAPKKGVQTVTLNTPTVQCSMCKERIERYMAREEGVQKVTVDYKKKKTKVTYVAERTNVENIKTAIANAGYDAEDVTANEEAYNELPNCCKKPKESAQQEH